MFFKKKKEQPKPTVAMLPDDLRAEMYNTLLNALKTALSQPDRTMTPEQILDKICPPGMFSEEDRARMLRGALGQ